MEKNFFSGFEASVEAIIKKFGELEKKQDAILQKNREFIRDCAKAIRFLHIGDLESAEKILESLKKRVKGFSEAEDFENISNSALQEFVEFCVVLNAFKKEPLPSIKELQVNEISYLNGYADATGEMRRAMQISLKNGDIAAAEYYFTVMDKIYDLLMSIRFSSSLAGDLKRRQDVARGQIEHARSELLRAQVR